MLTSITPLGERGRASRWPVTVTAYVIGSAAGGLVIGTIGGLLGATLPLQRRPVAVAALAVLALVCALAVLVELRLLPAPPTLRRQVDEDWLHRYRGWVYGVGFGAQLGFGVATIVTSTSLYVTLLLAVLTGSPAGGAVVGLVFGLVRALPVVGLRSVRTPDRLRTAARRTTRLEPVAQHVVAGALTLLALAAAGQLVALSVSAA